VKRLFAVVIMLLFWVVPVFAQDSYRDFERGLNLSESQRNQVDGIRRKYTDEWRGLKEESMRKRVELRELNREQPDNRDKAERMHRDLNQIESSRHRLLRQYNNEVSGVFNDDQRTRYDQFRNRENRRPVTPPDRRYNER
jgi:hypothetical protein